MAQTAAHLVEQVIPWGPTRQWVVSVPVPLRYWMAASQELTAQVHTIIRTTIGQYYVRQAVARSVPRAKVQAGSVTFIQRFGSALNLNLHFHWIFQEGVYLDRTNTHPWSDGTTGIRLSPMELIEKLAALVPLPRMHLVRYGGCLAPHSHLRGAIIPTPRQQGMADEALDTGSPRWGWARLLKWVFVLDMARCPFCQRGTLRIIAAMTHGEVIRKILWHLKLAVDPPPIAPARVRQDAFAWSSA